MPNDSLSGGAHDRQTQHSTRSADLDLEVWKHFASTGGADKSTMITVVSWLLGIGAGAVAYIATQLIRWTPPKFQDPTEAGVVALVGVTISLVAAYLTLLYGGYANINWAKADEIAGRNKWYDLLPDPSAKPHKPGPLNAVAWRLAKSCLPQQTLPLVFKIFLFLATLFAATNIAIIYWARFG